MMFLSIIAVYKPHYLLNQSRMAIQSTMSYSITIRGPSGCGKSAYMRRHATGQFTDQPYHLTSANLVFPTNYGPISIHCIEYTEGAGAEHADAKNANAEIHMVDLTNHNLIIPHLVDEGVPMVLCGNKVDKIHIIPADVMYSKIHENNTNIMYYPISAKSNYNFEKPFLYLLRQLTGKQNLQFM